MTPDEKRDYMRQWRAEHRDQIRKYNRDWWLRHPEYGREWYANHAEQRRAEARAYARRKFGERRRLRVTREEQLARRAAYRKANAERISEYMRNWTAANLDKKSANEARRRARAGVDHHTLDEWLALLVTFGDRCAICGANGRLTRDHIIPLLWGGGDTIDNIQPLCRSCNAWKGARIACSGIYHRLAA